MEKQKMMVVYGKTSYTSPEYIWRVPEKVQDKYDIQIGDCLLVTDDGKTDLMIITKLQWIMEKSELFHENPPHKNGKSRRIEKVLKKVTPIPKYLENLHKETTENR